MAGPVFTDPAWWQWQTSYDLDPAIGAHNRPRDVTGAVTGLVVEYQYVEISVVLGNHGANGSFYNVGFIPSRDQYGDPEPGSGYGF